MKSVIVHGPQGCGKTRNAELLKKHFRLTHIVDGLEDVRRANELRSEGTLYLAQMNPLQTCRGPVVKDLSIRVFSFKDAMLQCARGS
jgi:hypothetical protein